MKQIIVGSLILVCMNTVQAQEMKAGQHKDHMSNGSMSGHMHKPGEVMFMYRYMGMHMDGNRDGTDRVSDSEVLADYMVTPTSMDMDMHMFGAMYGVNDSFTAMVMLPYVTKSMKHLTRMGGRFTTKSEGIGDLRLAGMYKLSEQAGSMLHFNLGISLPTGSIDERDDTPAAMNAKLPYPMQLGSGTYDLMPGISYRAHGENYSWGAQAMATIRLGENDNDYTLGDKLELSGWVERKLGRSFSVSARLNAQSWSDIDGADPDLNPAMIPTADPELRSGKRVDLLLGVNYDTHKGNRFGIEVGKPVYQNLDGPQLETDTLLTANWRYTF